MTGAIGDITREELWDMMERGDDFVLVDALSPISYAASHLPRAVNIPPATEVDRAPRRIPSLETQVVVYCMNPTCYSSVSVANRLAELGYRNVRHYPGGKEGWIEAGLPLEGGRV
jgi:rhodanese-related sulfurtransferase